MSAKMKQWGKRMAAKTKTAPPFVQISVVPSSVDTAQEVVYALDTSGRVWYLCMDGREFGWERLTNKAFKNGRIQRS